MANPAADYPAAIHTPVDLSGDGETPLGATPQTHTEVHGKVEQEIQELQKKLGIGESNASDASTGQVLTKRSNGKTEWLDPTGGGGGGSSTQFVFDTSAEQSGNVYSDFGDLMAAIEPIQDGSTEIIIRINQNETVDIADTWNWDYITFCGNFKPSTQQQGIYLEFTDGLVSSWKNARLIGGIEFRWSANHIGWTLNTDDAFMFATEGSLANAINSPFISMSTGQSIVLKADFSGAWLNRDTVDGFGNGCEFIHVESGPVNVIFASLGAVTAFTNDLVEGDGTGSQVINLIANPATNTDVARTDSNFVGANSAAIRLSRASYVGFDPTNTSGNSITAKNVQEAIEQIVSGFSGAVSGIFSSLSGKLDSSHVQNDSNLSSSDNLDVPNVQSVKQAIADAVTGLLDDRGQWDASGDTFPADGDNGSGPAGQILKGDLFEITVGGTLDGTTVATNDLIRALVDSPGQTGSNWAITTGGFSLGYTPENVANKSNDTALTDDSTTDYVTEHVVKFVRDALTTVIATKNAKFIGTYSFASDTIVFYSGASTLDIDLYTPTLGDMLRVRTGGSKNFGLGSVTALAEDMLYYDGTNWRIWYNSASGTGAVATDTIWDAKGDLAVGSGADTASKLTVGNDGQILRAKASSSNGVFWDAEGGWAFRYAVNDYILTTRQIGGGYTSNSPSSSAANSNNQVVYIPVYIAEKISISSFAVQIVAANAGASAVVRLGIYSDDGAGRPGTVVKDAGTASINTTGIKEITFSDVVLQPGYYWVAAVLQNLDTAGTNPTWAAISTGSGTSGGGDTALQASNNMFVSKKVTTGISGAFSNSPTVTESHAIGSVLPHVFMKRSA